MKDMSSYSYQVVGGLHRFLAILEINEEKKIITTRKCAIYGTGGCVTVICTFRQ